MRKNIDDVEIVEPPIGELGKKYSTFSAIKRACLAGCGCLVVLIIGAVIFLRVAMGSGPETLKKVPANFPSDIPIYDKDNIEQITFISGKYKNRGVEIAAFFPKIILSPLFLSLDKNQPAPNENENKFISSIKNLWKIIRSPVSDHRDTVQIEWKNLDAEPTFIINYYKTELKKQQYKIDLESEGGDVKQFSFSKDGASGSMYVQGDEEAKPGADYAVLTVNISTSTTR
ncbi:MAG: hypothetical protein AAB348_02795 [Patescibacteria group bacterium]